MFNINETFINNLNKWNGYVLDKVKSLPNGQENNINRLNPILRDIILFLASTTPKEDDNDRNATELLDAFTTLISLKISFTITHLEEVRDTIILEDIARLVALMPLYAVTIMHMEIKNPTRIGRQHRMTIKSQQKLREIHQNNLNISKSLLDGLKDIFIDFKSIGILMYGTLQTWDILLNECETIYYLFSYNHTIEYFRSMRITQIFSTIRRRLFYDFFYNNDMIFRNIEALLSNGQTFSEYLVNSKDNPNCDSPRAAFSLLLDTIEDEIFKWHFTHQTNVHNINGENITGKLVGFRYKPCIYLVKIKNKLQPVSAENFTFIPSDSKQFLNPFK